MQFKLSWSTIKFGAVQTDIYNIYKVNTFVYVQKKSIITQRLTFLPAILADCQSCRTPALAAEQRRSGQPETKWWTTENAESELKAGVDPDT